MNPVGLFIIGVVVIAGLYLYSRKKKGKGMGFKFTNPFAKKEEESFSEVESEREPEREIYIMLKYSKRNIEGKDKQPPPLLWPNPFGSVKEIESWRDTNPRLMEGVESIVEAPGR